MSNSIYYTPTDNPYDNLKDAFADRPTRYVPKASVYCRETGELVADYYKPDLNELTKRLHNQYFLDKRKLKLVSSCGYVEWIG